jgi:hypothetical protein
LHPTWTAERGIDAGSLRAYLPYDRIKSPLEIVNEGGAKLEAAKNCVALWKYCWHISPSPIASPQPKMQGS